MGLIKKEKQLLFILDELVEVTIEYYRDDTEDCYEVSCKVKGRSFCGYGKTKALAIRDMRVDVRYFLYNIHGKIL